MVGRKIVFHDSFAVGWSFAVGEWSTPALDLRESRRAIDGVEVRTKKVGPNLAFHAGSVFWDHSMGYLAEYWRDALPHINTGLCVIDARPAGPLATGTGNASFFLGSVTAEIFRIKPDRTGVVKTGYLECTQLEFVNILKRGLA